MTRAERDAFFKAAESEPQVVYVFLRMLYETASRVTEGLHLRWGAVDLKARVIRVTRIKGSETIVTDIGDRLVGLLSELGPGKPDDLVFPGRHSCQERIKGTKRPRIKPPTWETCPGNHMSRFRVWDWCARVGARIGVEVALRHPHTLKHTRCCDEARQHKDHGVHAMIAAVKRLTGHKSADSLLVYVDEPEMIVEATERRRAELDKF